jgi:hypothetical protein
MRPGEAKNGSGVVQILIKSANKRRETQVWQRILQEFLFGRIWAGQLQRLAFLCFKIDRKI